MIARWDQIQEILACPRCFTTLRATPGGLACANGGCSASDTPYEMRREWPILVDFEQSILDPAAFRHELASAIPRSAGPVRSVVRRVCFGENRVAAANEKRFIELVKKCSPNPRVLIVGGASLGSGMKALTEDSALTVIGFDVYASPLVTFIADAHRVPLLAESVDGIWVQAVLEHVLAPWAVAEEMHRVLKPEGVVYVETAFLQPVHEESYDFVRFTHSGHRWILRRFSEVDSGAVGGPATSLLLSIEHASRAFTRSWIAAKAIKVLFSPLRLLDRFMDSRSARDAAPGVFFLGTKAVGSLPAREMPGYFRGLRRHDRRS